MTFSSQSLDLRFLGGFPKQLTENDIQVAHAGGRPVTVITLLVGFGAAPINGWLLGPRFVLANGFHRVFALLIALSWVAMFLMVSMPAGVKMLPRLGGRAVERSIVGYLKEFLPDRIWKYGDVPSVEEINEIAGRFAANAFWPTGNSQAWWLFFFSTATFFVILFPLRFSAQHVVKFVAFYVFLAALAVAVTGAMFRALTLYVGYVDERLVGRGLEKSKG
jgi:hypothetical protein